MCWNRGPYYWSSLAYWQKREGNEGYIKVKGIYQSNLKILQKRLFCWIEAREYTIQAIVYVEILIEPEALKWKR